MNSMKIEGIAENEKSLLEFPPGASWWESYQQYDWFSYEDRFSEIFEFDELLHACIMQTCIMQTCIMQTCIMQTCIMHVSCKHVSCMYHAKLEWKWKENDFDVLFSK
jgi:hypothetical protein